MENTQIANALDEVADLLELSQANEFRIRAYRRAARSIRGLSRRVEDLLEEKKDLTKLANIGKGTADKIREIRETGTCRRLEELKRQVPEQLAELMKVPQLGPRKAMQVHKALGIETMDGLKKACRQGSIRDLPGMGRKTEENILKGIKTLASASGRHSIKAAKEYADSLGRHLDRVSSIKQWAVAGSFRRRKETVGDLDVLIQAKDRSRATEETLAFESVGEVVSRGKERVTVRLKGGLQVDFRYFEPGAFGSAMMYFTGSKAHNIALRKRAQHKGWKLNEYGLVKGKRTLAGKTEESVYHRLNLAWIPPELREDQGEVEAAEHEELPVPIEFDDIRGDLHVHSKASDGTNTIEEMMDAARQRGYQYLAITDHSKAVTVANGLDEKRLMNHAERIREVNESVPDFWLLAGVEVDILKSGKLDLDEDVLAGLDWVCASIHSYFNLDEKKMTNRILTAVRSGVVHCIGHPCGRMIGQRDPIAFDVDRVFEACRDNGVCLEINAQPERLDLPDTYCRRARNVGVAFVIGTDAHKQQNLDFMPFGVGVARRGWLEKKDVINTRTARVLEKRLTGAQGHG